MVVLLSQLFSIEEDFTPDAEKQRRGLNLLLTSNVARPFVPQVAGQIVGTVSLQIVVSTAEGGPVG